MSYDIRTVYPMISIITVVYNAHTTIRKTIESVINQSYRNIEYIVIDGGSTDGTLDIINEYKHKISKFICEPDNGIYDAMNKGIRLSSGDYIALLNADDWYELDAVEIVVKEIHNKKFDVYYGIARILNTNLDTVDIHGCTIDILNRSSLAHQTCFVSSSVYNEYLYDTAYRSAADYDFICKLVMNKKSFKFIEKILVNYKIGGMSDSKFGQIETYKIRYKYGYVSYLRYLIHAVFLKLSIIWEKL